MTLQEIKDAVDAGKTVCWKSELYKVIPCSTSGYLINCTGNNHAIGLTHKDGVTMNGDEEDFFIKDEPRPGS